MGWQPGSMPPAGTADHTAAVGVAVATDCWVA